MGFRRFDRRRREPQQRVNNRIRVPEIRVIDADGSMLGVMQTHDALRKARDQGLDLVEINPKANPPVCKILDYGKYKYEEAKKKRETKRKQSTVEVKEIKMRPKTDDHDLEFKARAARRFIESGNKVKFTVRFRGREITHPQKAREQLVWIQAQCEDIANVEGRPTMEGRTMTMIMSPKQTVLQALANSKAEAERIRKEAEDARRAEKANRTSGSGSGDSSRSHAGDSDMGQSDPGDMEPSQASSAGEPSKPGKAKASGKGNSSKAKPSGKGDKSVGDKPKAAKPKADKASSKGDKPKAAKASSKGDKAKADKASSKGDKAKADKAKTAKPKAAKASSKGDKAKAAKASSKGDDKKSERQAEPS